MGCEVTTKKEHKYGAPQVQALDVEYINNNDGFDGWAGFLSRGKYRIHYLPFLEDGEEGLLHLDEIKTTELPTYVSFWVSYSEAAVCSRIDHRDEDALTYYRNDFFAKNACRKSKWRDCKPIILSNRQL